MPVRLRLQRHGKKGKPFYHIVAADARAPRDGKFIERIGSYNPTTNPATIDLDVNKAVTWMTNGAQPTDTVRAILSYKGAMYKKHLLGGVAKGAFSQEEADKKFEAWLQEKESKITGKVDDLSAKKEAAKKAALKAEEDVNAKRAEEIAAKNAPVVEETEEATEEVEAAAEETTEEAPAAEAESNEAAEDKAAE